MAGPRRGILFRLASLFWNHDEGRLRALWRIAVLAVALVGATLAVRESGLLPERGTRAFVLVGMAVRTVLVLLVVAVVGRFVDRRRLVDYGLRLDRGWVLDLGFGLALGAALMTGIFLVLWGLGWIQVTGTFRTAVEGEPFARAILGPVAIFVGVGVVEELLTRGYLLRNVAEGLGFPRLGGYRGGLVLACLLSSVLFALAHAGNPNATWLSTVNIGFAGIFLALGYVLTGQLGIPIGLHITWNLFQASVFGFPVSGMTRFPTTFVATEATGPEIWTGGAFGPEAGLVGLLAMLVGTALTVVWAGWRGGYAVMDVALAEPPARRRSR